MHGQRFWDARGPPLCRPIRWILYLYVGRVVPFTMPHRLAESSTVQETCAAVTYGTVSDDVGVPDAR